LDFWERHSLHFLEMAFETHKRETLEKPDGYGRKARECGDTVEIFLMLEGGKIRSASFETNGCLYAVACANAVVHLAEGKSLQDAHRLTPKNVMDYLVTLPEKEAHCAELAVNALHMALESSQGAGQPFIVDG
jgi:nitrogen fixation NifU-like protein